MNEKKCNTLDQFIKLKTSIYVLMELVFDPILKLIDSVLSQPEGGIMIRKVNGGWAVFSESSSETKKLSRVYKSKEAAEKRLREIEFFKNQDKEKKIGA